MNINIIYTQVLHHDINIARRQKNSCENSDQDVYVSQIQQDLDIDVDGFIYK